MSGLEDLYREIILDHYRSPRNRGELETPPAHRTEGFNPLCGDEVVVYIELDDDDRISDIKIGGNGCSISQSSASMMSGAVKGKTIAEAREITGAFKSMMSIHETDIGGDGSEAEAPADGVSSELKLGDLEALRGVVKFPVRIKCATLSWNTLAQAFDEVAEGGVSGAPAS
ncbi:MAG: Fe-S cluster assembly sulfur transfer protein SufU [Actinomycetota bacterium]